MDSSSRIFSPGPRKRESPASHNEAAFEYIDTSSEEGPFALRDVLDDWFCRYPEAEGIRLASDLSSKDDRQFLGAFWELYLHESFLRSGFSVECHPTIDGQSTHPDFRISRSGECFYVEARLVGSSDEKTNSDRRELVVREVLDRTKADLFFLQVILIDSGGNTPRGRRLRHDVEKWLDTLDPDYVTSEYVENRKPFPSKRFNRDGWVFDITAHPVRSERRGLPRKAVGIYGHGAAVRVETPAAIRKRLHAKAGKYKGLDAPLIPALLVHESPFAREDHVLEALFGSEAVSLEMNSKRGIVDATPVRTQDGVWNTPLDRSGKLVAGCIVAVRLCPWTIGKLAPLYWANPLFAEKQCELPWQVREVKNGSLTTTGTFSPEAFLDLPAGWPRCKV